MNLLFVGDGNFNYVLSKSRNYVEYVAKPDSGCDNGVFGSISYFKKWLEREIDKNELATGRITANGFRILNGKII